MEPAKIELYIYVYIDYAAKTTFHQGFNKMEPP
jgi:hypothetical protein